MAVTKSQAAREAEWRAQDALSTLTRAAEIQADRKLMAQVKQVAQKQVTTLSKVAGSAPKASATPKRAAPKAKGK